MHIPEPPTGILAPYIHDISAVLDSQQLPSSVLLGYSHGGFFTTWFALTNPLRVSALVLMEPALFSDPDELRQRARLAAEGNVEESLKLMLKQIEPTVGLDDIRATRAAGMIRKAINSDQALANELTARAESPISKDQLKALRMPTLLIGGGRSHVKWITTELAALLPHAHVWWLPQATHGDLGAPENGPTITKIIDLFISQVMPDSDDIAPGH
jgi:pimeloyl-ACP methyl ester carboxylesterase